MNRYNEDFFYKNGEADFTMKKVDGGRWVKFSDVEPLIEALRFYERGDNMKESGCATYVGKCDQDADHGEVAREALNKAGIPNA